MNTSEHDTAEILSFNYALMCVQQYGRKASNSMDSSLREGVQAERQSKCHQLAGDREEEMGSQLCQFPASKAFFTFSPCVSLCNSHSLNYLPSATFAKI